jgi:cyclic pyranopterin phosphate synthase
MVDVSKKAETVREAVVRGSVFMNPKTFKQIMSGKISKGDVLAVAKVAGIMAAKRTSEIIPMCHPLNLSHVQVNFYPYEKESQIDIEAKVKIKARTGVEMEGFVAVAAAGLTIYDMCKAVDRGIVISDIHLVKKTGGKSGTYTSKNLPSPGGRGCRGGGNFSPHPHPHPLPSRAREKRNGRNETSAARKSSIS